MREELRGIADGGNGRLQSLLGAGLGPTQRRLECAEGLLDRVEVGGIGR